MSKQILTVLVLCLLSVSVLTCDDGYFEPSDSYRTMNSISSKAKCVQCSVGCKTCNATNSCEDLMDSINGAYLNSGSINSICSPNSRYYNKDQDTCDRVMPGCTSAMYDYNFCTQCATGWDYNKDGRDCLRATLGITATNFVLIIIIMALSIVSCIKAGNL